jgi:hypothetical protein
MGDEVIAKRGTNCEQYEVLDVDISLPSMNG